MSLLLAYPPIVCIMLLKSCLKALIESYRNSKVLLYSLLCCNSIEVSSSLVILIILFILIKKNKVSKSLIIRLL